MKIQLPVRVVRRYRQRLIAPPEDVFPLLCPVREADWIDGWDPSLVVTRSGVGEEDCVFVTSSGGSEAVWYITRHEPTACLVEMIKITPGVTACRLKIEIRAVGPGSEADVTYAHTSLGPAGDAFVAAFTESYYEGFMREWEARLNHYRATGELLRAHSD